MFLEEPEECWRTRLNTQHQEDRGDIQDEVLGDDQSYKINVSLGASCRETLNLLLT